MNTDLRAAFRLFFAAGCLALSSLPAGAGVGGAGNTGDGSIQFDFARGTALSILRSVTPEALFAASGRQAVVEFYARCRSTLYVGTLRTQFEVVPAIADNDGLQALAQRLPGNVIRVSRSELEKLAKSGALSGPLLTGVVLHEVGHDCAQPDGRPTDDAYDSLLSALAEGLIAASNAQATAPYIDLAFIEQVKAGKPVRFLDLSSRVRKALTERYLDYLGDWLYLRNRAQLGPDRPAPASDFRATAATSLFPGWGSLDLAATPAALRESVTRLLQQGYEQGLPAVSAGGGALVLPVTLGCVPAGEGASCELSVALSQASIRGLGASVAELKFRLSLFGELAVEKIAIRE